MLQLFQCSCFLGNWKFCCFYFLPPIANWNWKSYLTHCFDLYFFLFFISNFSYTKEAPNIANSYLEMHSCLLSWIQPYLSPTMEFRPLGSSHPTHMGNHQSSPYHMELFKLVYLEMTPFPVILLNGPIQTCSFGDPAPNPPHPKPVQIYSLCSPCICWQVSSWPLNERPSCGFSHMTT